MLKVQKNAISTTQLAKICGVSQGTVDRALNGRPGISEKTKELVLRTAKEYGYRPNIHAKAMAGGKSMLIGVVVFDLNNQYFSDILTSITDYCRERDYSTVVMFTDREPEREIECVKKLYHMAVDGLVICPSNRGESYETFLQALDIPIITIGNRLDRLPYVGINNEKAMRESVAFVLEKGYDRLVYVLPNLHGSNSFAQDERLRAFEEAAKQRGVDHVISSLAKAEEDLEPDRKNALICPTDILAIQLLDTAEKNDAGIISFDNIWLLDTMGLTLDSVAYDTNLTAKQTVDYIIDGTLPDAEVPHRLIKRGSV